MHYTFHRNNVLGRETRFMPAIQYNKMRLLFQRCGNSCLFIPIRSLQYLAVIDHEEIIFVDSHRKAYVEFSWQKFTPQARNSLDDPVAYEFVYYEPKALETLLRVQGEFAQAIHAMGKKQQEKTAHHNQTKQRVVSLSKHLKS